MISVESKVKVYEQNGAEVAVLPALEITIRSHWNRNEMIELEVDGKRLTVAARDLQAAITNATNSARF